MMLQQYFQRRCEIIDQWTCKCVCVSNEMVDRHRCIYIYKQSTITQFLFKEKQYKTERVLTLPCYQTHPSPTTTLHPSTSSSLEQVKEIKAASVFSRSASTTSPVEEGSERGQGKRKGKKVWNVDKDHKKIQTGREIHERWIRNKKRRKKAYAIKWKISFPLFR